MRALSSFLHRLQHHSWTERITLGLAALCCLAMWGALRLVPFATLVHWTGKTANRSQPCDQENVDHIAWAVRTAGHHLFPDRPCLPQALAARFLLARLGVPTDLQIGVQRPDGDGICAHAWLEREQEVVIGGDDARAHYDVLTVS